MRFMGLPPEISGAIRQPTIFATQCNIIWGRMAFDFIGFKYGSFFSEILGPQE